jgi:hypothetical protein
MRRLVVLAIVLAGALAAADPVLADPYAAAASDPAKAAAAAEQSAPPAPVWPSSSDQAAPAGGTAGREMVPFGFGWG